MTATILYIEDNPLNMRLVRKLVNSFGYKMIEAMDGITGLEMVKSERPDLVLVDVNLPGMDGLQIATAMKTNPELASIPVIALTANAMHGDRERCLAAGCDAYIAKPIARQELFNALQRFLTENSDSQAAVS
jgi:two-component system, cell cycle response regulator DivK